MYLRDYLRTLIHGIRKLVHHNFLMVLHSIPEYMMVQGEENQCENQYRAQHPKKFKWLEKAVEFKEYITHHALYPHTIFFEEDNEAFHHKYIRHTVTKTIFLVMDVLGEIVSFPIVLPLRLLAPVHGDLAHELITTSFRTVGAVVARTMFRPISLSTKAVSRFIALLAQVGI